MIMTVGDFECAQDLNHECVMCHHNCGIKMCAVSVHVRHASVEVQVQCVNVVIGVVLGELHVVRVVPVFLVML